MSDEAVIITGPRNSEGDRTRYVAKPTSTRRGWEVETEYYDEDKDLWRYQQPGAWLALDGFLPAEVVAALADPEVASRLEADTEKLEKLRDELRALGHQVGAI